MSHYRKAFDQSRRFIHNRRHTDPRIEMQLRHDDAAPSPLAQTRDDQIMREWGGHGRPPMGEVTLYPEPDIEVESGWTERLLILGLLACIVAALFALYANAGPY